MSINSAGVEATRQAFSASISDDGRQVAFASQSDNLVPGDTDATTDVFVRDREANTTSLASAGLGGTFGDGHSFPSVISADGCHVTFASVATNLVTGDLNGSNDVFVRELPGCPEPGHPSDPVSDSTPPSLQLRVKGRQSIAGPLKLSVSCDEACTVRIRGRAKPKHHKPLILSKLRAELAAGEPRRLRLRFSRRVRRKLDRTRGARARVVATAVDPSGNRTTARRKIRLTRGAGG